MQDSSNGKERIGPLTVIEIKARVDSTISDEESAYFCRVELTPLVSSTTEFDRVMYRHLGFHWRSVGKRRIKHDGDLYAYIGTLEPHVDAYLIIPPFQVMLENVGDSLMGVHIRLPDGADRCRMTILQEGHQPKAPRDIDDFIQFEGTWYATATINCLQAVRIEEIEDNGNSN